jgi:hypothetical protein
MAPPQINIHKRFEAEKVYAWAPPDLHMNHAAQSSGHPICKESHLSLDALEFITLAMSL